MLRDEDVALVIVNAQVRDLNLGTVIEERRLALPGRSLRGGSAPTTFDAIIGYISFIGCVVMERQLWRARRKTPGFRVYPRGVIFRSRFRAPRWSSLRRYPDSIWQQSMDHPFV